MTGPFGALEQWPTRAIFNAVMQDLMLVPPPTQKVENEERRSRQSGLIDSPAVPKRTRTELQPSVPPSRALTQLSRAIPPRPRRARADAAIQRHAKFSVPAGKTTGLDDRPIRGADLIRKTYAAATNTRSLFRSFLELPLQLGHEFRFLDNDCEFTAVVEALSRQREAAEYRKGAVNDDQAAMRGSSRPACAVFDDNINALARAVTEDSENAPI